MLAEPVGHAAATVAKPSRLHSLPILLLNVHENCNCRCLMCDIWKRPRGSALSLEDFSHHRQSLLNLGVGQVVLTGGEPLLHPALDDLCRFLKDCRVRVTLLTTGLLLHKRAELIVRWMDEVIVSLDGPEAVHDGIRRVPRGFALIRQGLATLRRLSPDLPVHARSTVQLANFRYLRATVGAARELGVDSISFLAADVSSQAFNRELVWPDERRREIALPEEDALALEEEMESLIEQFGADLASGFIVESPAKLRGIARRFREQLGQVPPIAPRCNAPWVSAVVEVDGTVRPCFFHRSVGSLKDGTLEEVINSPAAQEFRRTLDIDRDPTCQRCVCSLNWKSNAGTS